MTQLEVRRERVVKKTNTMIPILRKVAQLNTMLRKNGYFITDVCTGLQCQSYGPVHVGKFTL